MRRRVRRGEPPVEFNVLFRLDGPSKSIVLSEQRYVNERGTVVFAKRHRSGRKSPAFSGKAAALSSRMIERDYHFLPGLQPPLNGPRTAKARQELLDQYFFLNDAMQAWREKNLSRQVHGSCPTADSTLQPARKDRNERTRCGW